MGDRSAFEDLTADQQHDLEDITAPLAAHDTSASPVSDRHGGLQRLSADDSDSGGVCPFLEVMSDM